MSTAGFNLKKGDMWRNFVPILLTAFIGTGISTCVIAYPIWQLSGAEPAIFRFLPKIVRARNKIHAALFAFPPAQSAAPHRFCRPN